MWTPGPAFSTSADHCSVGEVPPGLSRVRMACTVIHALSLTTDYGRTSKVLSGVPGVGQCRLIAKLESIFGFPCRTPPFGHTPLQSQSSCCSLAPYFLAPVGLKLLTNLCHQFIVPLGNYPYPMCLVFSPLYLKPFVFSCIPQTLTNSPDFNTGNT